MSLSTSPRNLYPNKVPVIHLLYRLHIDWFCATYSGFAFSFNFDFRVLSSWLQGEGQYRAEKRPAQRELHTSLSFSKGKDGYNPPQWYYAHNFWGILETLQQFISWRYICRFLEVTKSTPTQWHRICCRWLRTWNIMPEGYNPPERYYTHHFWEYEKLYRSLFLGDIGGKWLIPQPMCGYRITAHSWVRIFSTSLSLYTVRCQLRDSVDVLMWRQLQWLHAVLSWPQLQYLSCIHNTCTVNFSAATSGVKIPETHVATPRTTQELSHWLQHQEI